MCYSRILVIYSQIKALNGPLVCESARSSISQSFREMELIRKGQRVSQLALLCRVLSSLLLLQCCVLGGV